MDRILKVTHLPGPTGAFWRAGTHTITTAEDTANTLTIDTGFERLIAYRLMILTAAGVHHALTDAAISEANGVITVADGGATFVATATEVIHWIACGVSSKGIANGTHAVTAGEDTAGTLDIATTLPSVTAYFLSVLTAAGVHDPLVDAAISEASGTITVADGAATFTADSTDIIHWLAAGVLPGDWAAGTHTVTTAEAAADTLDIVTGLTGIVAYQLMISAADTITNASGSNTIGGWLVVEWYDHDYGETVELGWNN
jgi:hypothetical protein